MDWVENISQAASALAGVNERWDFLYNEIHKTDLEICDIEHDIENSNFNACQGFAKAKALQEKRRYRRRLKNEQMLLEPLHDYIAKNKNLSIDLFKIKTTMEKLSEQQKNWVYNPRTEGGQAV
jgi:uncharacterized protein (DUF2164 family)